MQDADYSGVPLQYQVYITWGVIAVKYLSEFYSSVRAGGGMKRIIMSFWFGESIPKVIADDYKHELSAPKSSPEKTDAEMGQ